jgi:putative ABC transport system permease protein
MLQLLLISKGIIERGLIYGILIIAMHISSRIIKFENMSLEGAFGLGGALNIVLLNHGLNPWLSLLITMFGGGLSGILTGLLNKKLYINTLISGIITTTALFSIILKLAGSNVILQNSNTIFNMPLSFLSEETTTFITLIVFCFLTIYICKWFLKTEIGLLLYAAGENEQILINIGKNATKYKLLGLAISNALAALSHALLIQYMGYFSIWFSAGILIIALAGIILSEIFTEKCNYYLLVGGILYQIIIALTFELQIHPDWNKLITASLIIITLFLKQIIKNKGE